MCAALLEAKITWAPPLDTEPATVNAAWLLNLPLARPRASVVGVLLVSALALSTLLLPGQWSAVVGREVGLRRDFSAESLFPDDDNRLVEHEAFTAQFGRQDDIALVLLTAPDVLDRDFLQRVHDISEDLRRHPLSDSDRVTSLSHVTFIRSDDGWLRVEPLFQPAEAAAWDRDAFAQRLLSHPIYRDQVLGADGKTCCFVVPLDPLSVSPASRSELVRFLRQYFEGITEKGQEFRLDGIVVTKETVLGLMAEDSQIYYPTALLALIVVLVLLFRNLAAALLTTLVVSLSVLWTLGFMALTGIPLNLVSTAMPVLILVAGVGDAVHLLTRFRQLLEEDRDLRSSLSEAVNDVGVACLLTSITTAAGFWSLSLAGVVVLREFGLPVGVGIISAWVISFGLLPPAILRLKTLSRIHVRPAGESSLGRGCWWLVSRHPGKVVILSALVLVLAVCMIPTVRVESRMLEDFGDDSPLQQTRRFVEERMGGVSTLEVILRRPADALPALAGGITGASGAGAANGRMLDPDVLAAVDRLEEWLRQPELAELGVLNSLAITDYIKDMFHILSEREPGTFVLPETRAGAAQLLLLYEGARPSDPTEDFVSEGRDVLRVRVRIRNMWTPEFFELVDLVEAEARSLLPGDVSVSVTGWTLMFQSMHLSMVRHLLQSLAVALSVVFLAVLMLSRSWRVAVLGLIPNLLPLILVLGFMGLVGIRLRVITSAIFCVAFGIAVDDTIHFLTALLQRTTGGDLTAAVRDALMETGPAMLGTTLILGAGFGVLALSTIQANQLFGALSALTLVLALALDLLSVPAFVVLIHRWQRGRA